MVLCGVFRCPVSGVGAGCSVWCLAVVLFVIVWCLSGLPLLAAACCV